MAVNFSVLKELFLLSQVWMASSGHGEADLRPPENILRI